MNGVREISRINEQEAKLGISGGKGSWHEAYRKSAWIFVGGLVQKLSEGDILCVFSQWGEIEYMNLCRDEDTGKSKGYAFIKYEDQRSTDLAVDNFNGTKLLGRTLRVDHKLDYNPPKKKKDERDGTEGRLAFVSNVSSDAVEEPKVLSRKEKKRRKKEAKRRKKKMKKEKKRSDALRAFQIEDARNLAKAAAAAASAVGGPASSAAASWRGRMDPADRNRRRSKGA